MYFKQLSKISKTISLTRLTMYTTAHFNKSDGKTNDHQEMYSNINPTNRPENQSDNLNQ